MAKEAKPKEYGLKGVNIHGRSSTSPVKDIDKIIAENMDYYENYSGPETIAYMESVRHITREDWFE